MNTAFVDKGPSRADIDAMAGPVVVEFGTPWCGWCRAAQPLVAAALASQAGVCHLKVEDGSGLPLGRSFGVKLWPTLIFFSNGQEVARLVRPGDLESIRQALDRIVPKDR